MARPKHAHGVDPGLKHSALTRLKRIEGQVRGIHRMVEEERYCADTLIQISAIQESLRAVAQVLLRNHLEHCAADAIRSSDSDRRERMYDELTELFFKHVR
jgi:DNA-binding FrmR family transcriptional regulator